ncbi:Efflux pump bik6 [Talaromyces pinophilus]|nr:Efflux pump bik6 [Talaromyces pinophilus]
MTSRNCEIKGQFNSPNPRAELGKHQSLLSRLRGRHPDLTMTHTHRLEHLKTDSEHIVQFDGPADPYKPLNWSFGKKTCTTILYGFITMGSAWASSAYSPAIPSIDKQYGISDEVGTLGTSLFLFGIGLGPLLWAPCSEAYGRKIAVLAPYFISVVLTFATAVSKDIQSILITRFFTGFFSSAPITNVGGVLSDIWHPQHRAVAVTVYALTLVSGTVIAPIVGGAVEVADLDWRWTEYITGMIMALALVLGIVFLDESFPPVLLVYKSRELRLRSGNWALHAQHEEWDATLKDLWSRYLIRPFQLLMTPICFAIALYASFVYGILYLSLASFPIQFQEIRGWNALVGALPFLGLFIGILLGAVVNIVNQRFYAHRFRANNNQAVPEARLPPMMLGSIFFTAGLFIMGWTSDAGIFWFGPICGAVCTGLGFFTIFQAALNYLIDTFTKYSASAVAVNTFLRSVFAGCFPLFANAMYHTLGTAWASSLLAFVSVGLIPIPFLFYLYGPRLRSKSKWSNGSM